MKLALRLITFRQYNAGGQRIVILIDMKSKDLRGVNLGGWLVLEKWITPSLFRGVEAEDEYTFSVELGSKEARRRLEKHRQSFITKKHLVQAKNIGLNAVRLPVGYWLFEDEDGFIGGGYKYVDKLFEWAEELDIRVLLCLHGAPGSQNGWDHSGRAGAIGWSGRGDSLDRTLGAVERICRRYGRNGALWGVEVINEPHPSHSVSLLTRYYRQSGRLVRRYCHRGVRWVVSDSFRPNRMVVGMIQSWFHKPVLDQHLYQLFTPEDRELDFDGHIKKTAKWERSLRRRQRWMEIVVGEWSAAMDELYQPELKKAARPFAKEQYVQYALAQQSAFKQVGCGWFYWTARTEDGGVWSLLDHPEFLLK